MPYAPNIQDISGQLMAQGISQAGNNLAQGFKEYQANQEKDRAARGIVTGILSQVPDLAQHAGEETLKLLDKFKSGNTGRDDNVYLAGLLATASKQKGEQQEQQARALQMQALQQQMAEKEKQAQQLKLLQQYGNGVGGGVLSPQVQNNPFFAQAAQVAAATGQAPSPESMLALAGRQGALNKANKPAVVEQILPSGARVAQSPGTGAFSVLPQTPQELGDAEGAKAEAKTASDYVMSVPAAAEQARAVLPQFAQIKSLFDQGTKSGAGQEYINNASSYLTRAGLKDPKQQANAEQLQALLATNALQNARALMQGQGSTSDAERARVDKMSADIGKTPEANLRIINYSSAMAQRAVDLENKRQELVDSGKSTKQVAEGLRRWQSSNPVQSYVDKMEEEASKPSIDDLVSKYRPKK